MSKFVDLDGSVPTPSRSTLPILQAGVHSRLTDFGVSAQSNAAKIRLLRMGNPAILLNRIAL
ncbi:MAG TPA: hypothetical protein V6D30_10885 [Leptolyngbyaceae cyanobacterium]